MTARPYWVEFPGSGADKGDPYCRSHNAVSLERALSDGGVQHTIEIYPAGHGFAVPDNPTYDPVAAQRHWDALAGLFGAVLSPGGG